MTTDQTIPEPRVIPDPLARDVEEVTDAQADEAARQAEDAAAAAEALEAAVADGAEDITAEDIAAQHAVSKFARLRAAAARRKADRAKTAARLRDLDVIRAEMDAHGDDTGPALVALLREAEDAVTAFCEAVNARNATLAGWHRRMRELGVPEHKTPIAPGPEHAGLGWTTRGYDAHHAIAGTRRFGKIDAGHWLRVMLAAAAGRSESFTIPAGHGHGVTFGANPNDPNPDGRYDQLAAVDAPTPEPGKDVHFVRGPGGAVWQWDHAPTAEDRKRGVTEISRKEAYGR